MKIEMKLIYGFIIVFFFYMDFVQGGCLSYGHSCWGGHGKRGFPSRVLRRPSPQMDISDKWALVKLFSDKNSGEITSKYEKESATEIKNNINGLHPSEQNLLFYQTQNAANDLTSSNELESKNDNKSIYPKLLRRIYSNVQSLSADDDAENNIGLPLEDNVDLRNFRSF